MAQRTARLTSLLLLFALATGAFLLWGAARAETVAAIRNMPGDERHQLFESTRRSLLSACEPARRPAGLERYCHDQAAFLSSFQECDASCRALVDRNRPQPRR